MTNEKTMHVQNVCINGEKLADSATVTYGEMSPEDTNRIGLFCNTLNAHQSLSNHMYSRTENPRDRDLSIILRNAQTLIWELYEEIQYLKAKGDIKCE